MGLIRKIIGWLLLTGLLPLGFFINWYFTKSERIYPWYFLVLVGYSADILVVVAALILIFIFSLIEED